MDFTCTRCGGDLYHFEGTGAGTLYSPLHRSTSDCIETLHERIAALEAIILKKEESA